MTPSEMHAACFGRDVGALDDLTKPERLAPVLGSVAGLLLLVNAREPIVRIAAGVLTAGSLYYGIMTRPTA